MRKACEDLGIIFTIWMTRNFTAAEALQACVASGAKGFLAEGEIGAEILTPSGPQPNPQAQNWAELIFLLSDLDIYKGTVTNFAPFVKWVREPTGWVSTAAPEAAAPLINAGWSCHTECYDMDGDPKLWIERRDFFSKQVGWPSTQPAVGLYGGRTWADFPTFDQYRNGSVWAAEYLI